IGKGWNNWFHTGKEMLNALELASAYQWDLVQRDLLSETDEEVSPFGPDKVWPFVIVGSHPYGEGIRKIVDENGGDGTVRVPAANLNTKGVTLDFATDPSNPSLKPWTNRTKDLPIPFAVLPDRTHATIIDPASPAFAAG